MRLFPASVACVLLTFSSSLNAQPIRFVRESLQFTLAADSFSFSGLYYFDNPGATPVKCPIYYPFVLSGNRPDSTDIIEVQSGKPIAVAVERAGVSFEVEMRPYSTQAYRISFVQRAPQRSLEYILKTTSAWGRPLDRATIKVSVPPTLVLKSLSLKTDSVHTAEDGTMYVIEREDLMPDENLIVRWGRKTP